MNKFRSLVITMLVIFLLGIGIVVNAQELEIYPVEIQQTWLGDICVMTENWDWTESQSPVISYTVYKNNVGQFTSAANEFVLLNNCDEEYSITWTEGLEAIVRTGWNDSSWDKVLFSVENTEELWVTDSIKDTLSGSLVVVYDYVNFDGEYQSGNLVIPQSGGIFTVPYDLRNANLIHYWNNKLLFSEVNWSSADLVLWDTLDNWVLFEGSAADFATKSSLNVHSESGNDISVYDFDSDGFNYAGWGSMNGTDTIEFFVFVAQSDSSDVRAKRLEGSPRTDIQAEFDGQQFIVVGENIIMIYRDMIRNISIVDTVNSVDSEVDFIDVTDDYIGG